MQRRDERPLPGERGTAGSGPRPGRSVAWEPLLSGGELVLARLIGVFDFLCVDAFNRTENGLQSARRSGEMQAGARGPEPDVGELRPNDRRRGA